MNIHINDPTATLRSNLEHKFCCIKFKFPDFLVSPTQVYTYVDGRLGVATAGFYQYSVAKPVAGPPRTNTGSRLPVL